MAQIPFLGAETSVNDTPFLGSPADTLNLDPVELKIRKGIANGYAPLDGNAKVPVANLPDTTSLDAEVDGKITTHNSATTSVHGIANTANLVLTNDSRLSGIAGGSINTSGGEYGGGSINTSNGGGSINTTGVGSIQLGVTGTRTTLNGSASGTDKTITLPNATGTVALTNDSRFTDSRTPTAHKSSHATGGTDALSASDIGAVATTDTRIANTRGGSIDTRAGAVTERTYETGDPENPTEYETSFAGGSGGNVLMRGGDGGFDMLGGGIGGNSGSINLSGFTGIGGDSHGGHGGSITLMGGWDRASAGSINLNAGSGGADNHGGSIISTGNNDHRGGTLNMSAGDSEGGSINTSSGGSINTSNDGGSINTSNEGGSINTRGVGSIQLGVPGTRTTLNGSANGNRTITLPNASGTIALTDHQHGRILNNGSHSHGKITDAGKVNNGNGNIISATFIGTPPSLSDLPTNNGVFTQRYNVIQAGGSQGEVIRTGLNTLEVYYDNDPENPMFIDGFGYSNGPATIDGFPINIVVGESTLPDKPLKTDAQGLLVYGDWGTASGTFCQGDDSRLSNARTPTQHYHGDIWNTGDLQAGTIITLDININTLANGTYPVLQPLSSLFPNTNNSTAQVSVSGTAPNKVLTILNGGVGYHASMGNKSITIGGIQGTIAGYDNTNKPVITNNHGFISAGSFGTTANSFCQGNDVRLGAKTVFTLGGDEKITYALGTSYVYGAHITRPSKVSGGFDQTGLYIQGNWRITGLVIMAYYPSTGTAGVTYGLVKINNASSVTNLWTAPSSNPLNNGLNNVVNNTLDISLSDGDKIGFQLAIGNAAGATVPTNLNNTTILANVYCVPR